jgi:hypothetical protein
MVPKLEVVIQEQIEGEAVKLEIKSLDAVNQ